MVALNRWYAFLKEAVVNCSSNFWNPRILVWVKESLLPWDDQTIFLLWLIFVSADSWIHLIGAAIPVGGGYGVVVITSPNAI